MIRSWFLAILFFVPLPVFGGDFDKGNWLYNYEDERTSVVIRLTQTPCSDYIKEWRWSAWTG